MRDPSPTSNLTSLTLSKADSTRLQHAIGANEMTTRKQNEHHPGQTRTTYLTDYDNEDAAYTAHLDALEAARAEHLRVREAAIRAYNENELKTSQARLRDAAARESERLKREREHAELAEQVIKLQKLHIPVPIAPPRVEAPSSQANLVKGQEVAKTVESQAESSRGHPEENLHKTQREIQKEKFGGASASSLTSEDSKRPSHVHPAPLGFNGFAPQNSIRDNYGMGQGGVQSRETQQSRIVPTPVQTTTNAIQQPMQQLQKPQVPQTQATPQTSAAHILPGAARYVEIHQKLKTLRKFMIESAKGMPVLKTRMGEMRREIRKSVGQLTDGRGANKLPMQKIINILKESLTLPSPPVDPGVVLVSAPPSMPGYPESLPALFIYLLNIFSKAVVAQFIDEAGVSPKAADPIGVIAVSIFAQKDFLWRETSLIDILLSKMRRVCPVLFGLRGNEKTEEGRARLGWWRDGGGWVNDQIHNTRMTGLGAGYAALALRDFSKSKMIHPYPPSKYWQTFASIVGTPEPASTQYIVLKAMIEGYEDKFLGFYGSAAKAALQIALVDLPERAKESTVASSSLKLLGEKLRRDTGLRLEPPRRR